MKIGFFMDDFYPSMNGVIEVMDNYAKGLIKKGYEVVMVVPEVDKNYVDNFDYKVYRLKSIRLKNFEYSITTGCYSKKVMNDLIAENFDVIHIHSPFLVGNLGIKLAKKCGIPVVSSMHTQFDYEIRRVVKLEFIVKLLLSYVARTFNKCDKNFAVNNKTADVFLDYKVKNRPDVMITGTDYKLVSNQKKAEKFVNELYKIDKNELVFSFVGRLTVVKNILFLLEALKILRDKKIDYKMIFVGPFEDEELIMDKVNKLGLNKNLIFTGKITDKSLLQKIYARSKLFLFPSLFDTNSLVQKEAASQKVPTVFIKGSVTAEFVVDNENGFLAENSPRLYAQRIIDIINDKKLYKNVSKNAYETLYIHWDDLIDDLILEYKNIIEHTK